MAARDTRAFMTLMAIAETPSAARPSPRSGLDREFFGHIKAEWPHLETITDAAPLEVEFAKCERNTTRFACTRPSAM